jgi:hypothetical protein
MPNENDITVFSPADGTHKVHSNSQDAQETCQRKTEELISRQNAWEKGNPDPELETCLDANGDIEDDAIPYYG